MSDKTEPSPRPWRIESDNLTLRPQVCFIIDANGAKVSGGFFSPADAALIVAAVNERDRLRDIVRRLVPLAETTVENIRALGAARFPFEEHIKSDRLLADINREVSNADYLLREARAAIGEDAK
jgi:hypothetical protein